MKTQFFLTLSLILALSACTTVSRGTTDYLRIDTVPQGAAVTTTIETYGSVQKGIRNIQAKKQFRGCAPTPCLLEVFRRRQFAIKIEHPGYEPAEIAIRGDIPMQTTNLDMAVPIGSIASNLGIGVAAGALSGTLAVVYIQTLSQLANVFTFNALSVSAPTGGIVAGATAAGAGFGAAMIGVDLISGSYNSIYPNPIVIKLAPEGAKTITDPNMLMFKLRAAKKRLESKYCGTGVNADQKRKKRNCALAKEMDKKRDIENAELLASEQDIKKLIATLKKQLKQQRAEARKLHQQTAK